MVDAKTVPRVKFNNGNTIPIIGLGMWQSKPGEVANAIKEAIDCGYRHFDGAQFYENEAEIGQAINKALADGIVKRSELFITSKLWSTDHQPHVVERACRKTLKDLKLDYVDLYLMHFPMGFQPGGDYFPLNENGKVIPDDTDYLDTWKAMEKLVDQGLVKQIGVSNFNWKQVKRLLEECRIKPVTNQVEIHPWLPQTKLVEYCQSHGVAITAYSSLGSPSNAYSNFAENEVLLKDTIVNELANKYGKTPAQILIRYIIERNIIVIPKSVTPKRIRENIQVFDFKLNQQDMKKLSSYNKNKRILMLEMLNNHKDYPFHEQDQ